MWQRALPLYHAHDGNLFIVIHCGHLKKDANSGSTSLGISKHVSSSSDWAAHLTVKIRRACFWACPKLASLDICVGRTMNTCQTVCAEGLSGDCAAAPPQLLPQQSREHSKTTKSQSRRGSISKKSYRLFQCKLFQYALFRILARILRCFWALHHKCNNSTRPVERHLESGLGGTSPPRVALRACKDVISFFSELFHDIRHKPVQQACHVSLGWVGRRVPSPKGIESNCANQRNQHKVELQKTCVPKTFPILVGQTLLHSHSHKHSHTISIF